MTGQSATSRRSTPGRTARGPAVPAGDPVVRLRVQAGRTETPTGTGELDWDRWLGPVAFRP